METNHIFCFSCGNKIQYNLSKPNFCTKCGSALGVVTAAKKTPQRVKTSEQNDDDFEDDDNLDIDYLPDIEKIDVEIEQYQENSSFTLGSIFGDGSSASYKPKRRRSVDDFIDERKP
jgi:ribosomal protein L37E